MPAAADRGPRLRQLGLLAEALEQLVHQPAGDAPTLARVDEAEVDQLREQHLPVLLRVAEQPLPVDPLALPQEDVGDVRAVVAAAVLDEELRPDELGRRQDPHLHPIEARGADLLEPAVGDRRDRAGRAEDQVREPGLALDLGDPALVLDLDLVAAVLEVGEDARVVAGLAEDVQVLRRPVEPRVRVDRIGPARRYGTSDSSSSLRIGVERVGFAGRRPAARSDAPWPPRQSCETRERASRPMLPWPLRGDWNAESKGPQSRFPGCGNAGTTT